MVSLDHLKNRGVAGWAGNGEKGAVYWRGHLLAFETDFRRLIGVATLCCNGMEERDLLLLLLKSL